VAAIRCRFLSVMQEEKNDPHLMHGLIIEHAYTVNAATTVSYSYYIPCAHRQVAFNVLTVKAASLLVGAVYFVARE